MRFVGRADAIRPGWKHRLTVERFSKGEPALKTGPPTGSQCVLEQRKGFRAPGIFDRYPILRPLIVCCSQARTSISGDGRQARKRSGPPAPLLVFQGLRFQQPKTPFIPARSGPRALIFCRILFSAARSSRVKVARAALSSAARLLPAVFNAAWMSPDSMAI